jgi:hypothetical protein
MIGESSPPLPHDLRAHLQPRGDLPVAEPVGRAQHDLRPLHVAVGQREFPRARLKLTTLLIGEADVDRAAHPHRDSTIPL